MNSFLKLFVGFLLKWLAKIYLMRRQPCIIAVIGTTGRHWIKENVIEALREKKFSARGNQKNFNAEIGLPLSILNLPSGEGTFIGWLNVLLEGIKKCFVLNKKQKEYLVLEMAIDQPEDMDYLLSIVNPQIAVFTTITMIYSENFEDLDEISQEYKKLVKILPQKGGLLINNNDDERIRELETLALCRVVSYGLKNPSDFTAKNIKKTVLGQQFELNNKRIEINRFGQHHIYAKVVGEIIKSQIN
ncbi:MAG: Mur ligase family protein [Patescibacteria group bacterium]